MKLDPAPEWLSGSSLLSSELKDSRLVRSVMREIQFSWEGTKEEIFVLVGILLDVPSKGYMPTFHFTSVPFDT